jgi:hypothetical protein
MKTIKKIQKRLEELRAALRAENISQGELHELQSLAEHIAPGDVELLENEYLTENEEERGHILACMSIAKSKKIKLNFDLS